jgi:hypothetical protein
MSAPLHGRPHPTIYGEGLTRRQLVIAGLVCILPFMAIAIAVVKS